MQLVPFAYGRRGLSARQRDGYGHCSATQLVLWLANVPAALAHQQPKDER
jgi:hypothetical protein